MPKYTDEFSNILIPDSVSDEKRQDFMTTQQGESSKGRSGSDPLHSQSQEDREISQEDIDRIYKHNRIAQNIIEAPAEDSTREWIDFEDTGDGSEEILKKLNELDAQSEIQNMIKYERLTGDGFIAIGAQQSGTFELEDELENNSLTDINYLHSFSQRNMVDAEINDDPFDEAFGDFKYYQLAPLSEGGEDRIVHPSRMIHFQTRVFENEMWGIPLMVALHDPLTILDNFAWSIGQIAYAMTFKVYKTPDVSFQNRSELRGVTGEMEKFFNSMSLAIIGEDEELKHEGPSGSLANIDHMSEFIWEYLSGSAKMPKSHILGQEQGTITGGQYDSLNYYMRISGIQENYLRPIIEEFIDLLYVASDSGVGNGRVEEPDYKLKFNPLWKLDRSADAEIRKLYAEIDEIYTQIGAQTPDEVRENRFDEQGFMDAMDLNQNELDELAEITDKKYKEFIKQKKEKK